MCLWTGFFQNTFDRKINNLAIYKTAESSNMHSSMPCSQIMKGTWIGVSKTINTHVHFHYHWFIQPCQCIQCSSQQSKKPFWNYTFTKCSSMILFLCCFRFSYFSLLLKVMNICLKEKCFYFLIILPILQFSIRTAF